MALDQGQRDAVQALIDANPALNNQQFTQLIRTIQGRDRKEKARLSEYSATDPSSWRTFRSRVLEAKSLNQWTDQEAKQHLKIAMTGTAAAMTRDIAVGGDPAADPRPADHKTFDRYLEEVALRFISTAATELAVSDFLTAEQKAEETSLMWHVRLLDLFTVAHPTRNYVADRDLIRQFCLGYIDEVVAQYIMDNNPQTFQRCLELAQTKEGNQAQRRRAAKRRGRVNALSLIHDEIHTGFEEERGGVNAINYSYGSATPSSSDANRELRRRGPQFGMNPQSFPQDFRSNSFLGQPRNGGAPANSDFFGRRRNRSKGFSQGRGGRRNRGQRGRGGRGGRARGRGGRNPNQRKVNAIPEYADTITHLGELFDSVDLSGNGANSFNSGNSERPKA